MLVAAARTTAAYRTEQEFFGSLFQKRTASFMLAFRVILGAMQMRHDSPQQTDTLASAWKHPTNVAGAKPDMIPDMPVAAQRQRMAILCLAVLLPWAWLLAGTQPINYDVAWFYYVARGVLHGGKLYSDFIEPNAPLASLSLVPAVWLSRLLSIGPPLAMEFTVLAMASVAMGLCAAVLQRMRLPMSALIFALCALAVGFVVLPRYFFGEREHLLAMLLVPYVLGCAACMAGVRLGRGLGCIIGVAAAFAVGLKPPFILEPAALEAAVCLHIGLRGCVRAQPLALAAGLLLIGGVTLVFFPLYVSAVVPWAVALYGGYDDLNAMVFNLSCVVVAGALVWLTWAPGRGARAEAVRVCIGVAITAGLVAFAVQGKGWPYQIFPAMLFVFLLWAGAIVTTSLLPDPTWAARARWIAARLLAVGFGWYVVSTPQHSYDKARYAAVAQAVAAEPGPFVVLSTDLVPGVPLALEQNRVWASRTPIMIMLPGLVAAEKRGIVSPWESVYRGWIDADMRRFRPALVFVPPVGPQAMPRDFDVLAWLLRDPAFAAVWSHYHEVGVRDGLRMFRLS